MTRAKWKNPYIDELLITKSVKKNNNSVELNSYSRKSVIVPKLINTTLNIHNGKTFSKIKVTEDMVGYKLGEFSPTRKRFSFKKTKNGAKN